MPAASWRTSPARTMSLWLIASASAGSSRSVGISERVQRMGIAKRLLGARNLVGPGHSGIVDQPLDGLSTQDVRLEDFLEVGFLNARVPDVVRVHDHHGAVTALREAAGLVDAHLGLLARSRGRGPERLDELLDVALLGAGFPGGADEDVAAILPHGPL